ncbi:TonB-dependent receptor [Pseudomaricurvus alcaniphilus]|uniref:TonB-dependent receptor plug domain-containing protein n=1 Tax=Pseudomaricurvus alcaniphilus TaxID=1166482 RepID=UPI00140BCA9A|nr:TonB-dependent receptor [Pseudomaricurvus alcaniphilus]NHN36118.1 TonB-dependent receptor [Pseudomaricurvus alcaniphilus]
MNSTKLRFNRSLLSTAVMLVSGITPLALVAPGAQAAKDSNTLIEEVVTIGTRVAGRTATEAAVPVDVIKAEDLMSSGQTELGQSLQSTAPSFNFTRTQVSDASDLFRPATLRGLQPDQTLVLINGKRRHHQSVFQISGTVGEGAAGTDMNSIPMIALQSVEVLRDGASAQYGSDAIAGVINLKLKDSVDETTGFVQFGQTGEGDGDTFTVGLNSGIALGDEGFFNASVEFRDGDGTNRAERDTGGSSTIAPGTLSDDVRFYQGDGETEFKSFFYNSAIPLAKGELYSFGGYSNREALGAGFWRRNNQPERTVTQVYPDGFLPRVDNAARDISFALGYRTELNDTWRLDVSGVYGENAYDFGVQNSINASIAGEYVQQNPGATDAEIAANAGPTSGNSASFEFNQTTFNVDLSGEFDWGGEPLYAAFGLEYRDEDYAITKGDFASYSCGSSGTFVSIPSANDPSVETHCGFQAFPGIATSSDSSRDLMAVYADFEHNFTDDWLVGVAARYEDYSDAGDELTGKIASRYVFTDTFALRGAIATGLRSPSLPQSSFTGVVSRDSVETGNLVPSFVALPGSAYATAIGVPQLDVETSTSFSLGFVYEPFDNLTVTLDAYRTEIKDRITLGNFATANTLADNTDIPDPNGAIAALAATGTSQAQTFSNSVDTVTEGIDLIVTYDTTVADGDFGVTLAANVNDTSVEKIHLGRGIFNGNSTSILESGQPGERLTLTLDYGKNAWSGFVRFNYYGDTEVDTFAQNAIAVPDFLAASGNFRDTTFVDAAWLVDIGVSWQVNENLTLSLNGNNVFDEVPRSLDGDDVLEFISNGGYSTAIRGVPYGFNGASYSARLNFTF